MGFFAIVSLVFTAATAVFAGPVVERDSTTPASLPVVLTNLRNAVTYHENALKCLTPEDATRENVEPITSAVISAMKTAIDGVNALQGQPPEVIYLSVDGTTVSDGNNIGTILDEIESLIQNVLRLVLNRLNNTLSSLLLTIVILLDQLNSALGSLTGGSSA